MEYAEAWVELSVKKGKIERDKSFKKRREFLEKGLARPRGKVSEEKGLAEREYKEREKKRVKTLTNRLGENKT